MPETKTTPPANGGSYKRNPDGSYTRLDTPQTANPGKTARRKAAAAKAGAGKTSASAPKNKE